MAARGWKHNRVLEVTMSDHTARVVVGIDGSAASDAALAWAADEAMRRKASLRVVHAIDLSRYSGRWQDLPPDQGHRDMSWSVLTSAIVDLEDLDLTVEPVLDSGRPASVLLNHARQAQLVVVGSRGRGEFADLLLGSTSLQLAMHTPCPLVVVREPQPDVESGPSAGRVVVGVDGSEFSAASVRFAFEEADRRTVGLTAVHAWLAPSYAVDGMPPQEREAAEEAERALLAELTAGWGEKFPDLDVRHRTARGDPVAVLVAESMGADLTVVGSRGIDGFRGLLLGSVCHAVLHHAGSPVAVVRSEFSP